MQIGIKSHSKKEMIKPVTKLDGIYKETEELVAIMAKSIETANKNKPPKSKDT